MAIAPTGMLDGVQVRHAIEATAAAHTWTGRTDWHFECTTQSIELHRDAAAGREDPVTPGSRLGLGAALMNLRLAIRSAGVVPDVRLLPDSSRPALIASVGCQMHDGTMPPGDRQLFEAIHHRTSPAGRIPLAPVPRSVLDAMRIAARAEHVWLAELHPENRSAVRDLLPAGSRHDLTAGSLVVCIGSVTDQPIDQLNAGQAVQRVLLTGVAHGVSVHFLPDLTTSEFSREELRRLIGGGLWPQAALRLSYPSPGSTDVARR